MTELVLDAFVTAIIDASDYEEMDRIYLKNRVMSRIGEEGLDAPAHQADLIALKDQLVELAVANSKIPDSMAAKDSLGAELMDWVTPSPSQVNRRFWETYRQSKEDAIADFYALSKHIISRSRRLQKILPSRQRPLMGRSKLPSICQNLKKIPKTLRLLKMPRCVIILLVNCALKMKAIKVV